MTSAPPRPVRFADLGLRLASGLALAAIALFDLWLGGPWVAALAAIATVLMLWEYRRMITGDGRRLAPAMLMLGAFGAGAVVATAVVGLRVGLVVLAVGSVAAVLATRRGSWLAAGLVYIGLAMCYLIVIRDSALHGLPIVLWLILVVVASDVGAYFSGRSFGGRKLWPAVSPGKTWSGAIGGAVFAMLVGAAFGIATGRHLPEIVALSLGASIAAQLGDLLESAVKRRCGIKDASRLIPGHGGVLDRLDGLIGALWFFGIYDMLLATGGI
jgi:phosphatidate cytidylyltransferase